MIPIERSEKDDNTERTGHTVLKNDLPDRKDGERP